MPSNKDTTYNPFDGYNHTSYDHFRMVDKGKREIVIRKGKEVSRTVLERVDINFDDIKKLNIDNVGIVMPTPSSGHYTQIQNYFIDFWMGVLGPGASVAYIKLQSHCYGKKNFCFNDIEIMSQQLGMARKTFNAHLEKLEHHGFIIRFWRENKDAKQEASPLFVVRQTVPMVPKAIIDTFSDELREEHESRIAELKDMMIATGRDTADHVGEIISKGVIIDEEKRKVNSKAYTMAHDKICSELTDKQLKINKEIHQHLVARISKPSYETFLEKAIFKYEEEFNTLRVLCYGEYAYGQISLSDKYINLIADILNTEMFLDSLISVTKIEDYLNRDNTEA